MRRLLITLLTLTWLTFSASVRVEAEIIYAITSGDSGEGQRIFSFDSAAPGTISTPREITGVQFRERFIGIDFRPATGELYGYSGIDGIYIINPETVAATFVATGRPGLFGGSVSNAGYGMDFDPVVDQLRVVCLCRANRRFDVGTGVSVAGRNVDYVFGDPNFGRLPYPVGLAYSNNFAGATSTTLYVIDTNQAVLAIQNPPDEGSLSTVGSLGVSTPLPGLAGFDISPTTGIAYAAIYSDGGTQLYTINLSTGAATLVGRIGDGTPITSLTVAPNRPPEVEITSPASGSIFQAGASVTATAAASDADGTIARVEFYAGETLVGADDTAPYSLTAENVPAGTYVVRARAIDNLGAATISAPVTIFVNAQPEVELTSPPDGSVFPEGATITATAAASDVDGVVTRVEFFANGFLVGTVTSAPYELTATDVPAGTYVLTARATDDRGGTSTSRPVTITVR